MPIYCLSECVRLFCSTTWLTAPATGSTVSYTYATDGYYDVNVSCYNNVSFGTFTFTQYVQYPVTNLALIKKGALVNAPFFLNFTVTQGTQPIFLISFNGGSPQMATYNAAGLTGALSSPLSEPVVGIYVVTVSSITFLISCIRFLSSRLLN